MRIVVLTGGATAERAVAFASASQIVAALRSRSHTVTVVDTVAGPLDAAAEKELLSGVVGIAPPAAGEEMAQRERRLLSEGLGDLAAMRQADVVFLAVHGGTGENGTLQAILDVIGVPYTGSGPLASALAMDKDVSKRLFRATGVPVPEQFIPGRELTVGVMGDVPLPVGEIVPKHELFDYETKYTPGMSEETFPAKIETLLARQLQEYALMAHRALKLGGYSRVDFRVSPEGDIFCLEANSLPGMTRTSLFPQAAQAAGIAFPQLCERIARLARNNEAAVRE
jgi:D-alanine-D-alanine ligase